MAVSFEQILTVHKEHTASQKEKHGGDVFLCHRLSGDCGFCLSLSFSVCENSESFCPEEEKVSSCCEILWHHPVVSLTCLLLAAGLRHLSFLRVREFHRFFHTFDLLTVTQILYKSPKTKSYFSRRPLKCEKCSHFPKV